VILEAIRRDLRRQSMREWVDRVAEHRPDPPLTREQAHGVLQESRRGMYGEANALRRADRSGVISTVAATAALADLLELPVELASSRDLVERAFELRANLTVMDGCYVALAERLGCGILTSDTRLARAPGLPVPVTLL
jgi:predicted nucleic acid-binding protein